jgi:isopenicillin N synthase-like dioxygenase
VISTRAINYERTPERLDPLPGQMRLGAHTDYGVLTLLWADDVPGLQIGKNGAWHDVSVRPGLLLANIGDMLTMWTNGRWHSTLHRVVPPPPGMTGPVRRRSVARFLDGYPGMVIECIPTCTSADNPPRFRPVPAGEWLGAKIDATQSHERVDLPSTAGAS